MPIAILDPFSGIAGDMTLGALVDVGLDADWLRALPDRLGLDGVQVRIEGVKRAGLACTKVDFDIPPQPHSRGIREIRALIEAAGVPADVRSRADATFSALAEAEGAIHGVSPDEVHLHEVGAVDAILDITGSVWGLDLLKVTRVYCGPLTVGEGTVNAAHGELPVPAPATMKLLEGLPVRPGPDGSGELVTPTGAALVRTLSSGPPPESYTPLRSGFGAGTRNPRGRANALRIILAEENAHDGAWIEDLVQFATDIDDMDGEELATVADVLRESGALDVVLMPTIMKKGRPGSRIEVLCRPEAADEVEQALFVHSSSIGIRRARVQRRALPREERTISVLGHDVRVKVVTLSSGARRAKPEHHDLAVIAGATGRALRDVAATARVEAERLLGR
jgi:uncharacterized protein (TIGR00299 family) protein